MTHRGRTLDQYNVQELRDLFLDMFCTTKNSSRQSYDATLWHWTEKIFPRSGRR